MNNIQYSMAQAWYSSMVHPSALWSSVVDAQTTNLLSINKNTSIYFIQDFSLSATCLILFNVMEEEIHASVVGDPVLVTVEASSVHSARESLRVLSWIAQGCLVCNSGNHGSWSGKSNSVRITTCDSSSRECSRMGVKCLTTLDPLRELPYYAKRTLNKRDFLY